MGIAEAAHLVALACAVDKRRDFEDELSWKMSIANPQKMKNKKKPTVMRQGSERETKLLAAYL